MTPEPLYNANVPQNSTDALATSQPQFLDNFLELFNLFLVNHVSLTSGATAGNHTYVDLVEQPKGFQTDVGEISIYSKDVEGQTDQLYMRYQGNGSEVQITNYQIYAVPVVNGIQSYFTFLPGGVILYFGSFATLPANTLPLVPPVSRGIITVSFCKIGNDPSNKPNIQFIANDKGFYTGIEVLSVRNPATPASNFYYLAMGIL